MNVGKLKELLDCFEDDVEVCVAYPAKDYWDSVLAGEVDEAELDEVYYSQYHQSFQCHDPDRAPHDDEHDQEKTVLLLRM